jgi:hypothetical protein
MALGMDYRSSDSLQGLAWVIPVPNIPDKIETASASLFKDLARWVEPTATVTARGGRGAAKSSSDLTIHPVVSAGAYRIQPIEARGEEAAAALNEWMVEEGFQPISEGQLDYYIDRSWTFLAVELDADKGLRKRGALDPLVLGFVSPTAVMPLKLTTHAGSFPVRIYLVTDNPIEDRAFLDAREKGFSVAKSASNDYLAPTPGALRSTSVSVESFAYDEAPASVRAVFDQAGEWIVGQGSLELRYLSNPNFGEGVGMSIYWEEELSIPGLPSFVTPAPSPTMDLGGGEAVLDTPSVPTEEDGWCSAGSSYRGLTGGLLMLGLIVCARRR